MKIVQIFMAIDADQGVLITWYVQTLFNSDKMVNFLKVLSNANSKSTWVFMENPPITIRTEQERNSNASYCWQYGTNHTTQNITQSSASLGFLRILSVSSDCKNCQKQVFQCLDTRQTCSHPKIHLKPTRKCLNLAQLSHNLDYSRLLFAAAPDYFWRKR